MDFPQWNPLRLTVKRFKHDKFRIRYIALRNSSNAFISKKPVRDYIFKKFGYKCTSCGSESNLCIDHVIPVCTVAESKLDYRILNTEENLTILCRSCNSIKSPN